MSNESDLITVGRVTKPHGIRGELKVVPLGISSERLVDLKRVCLRNKLQHDWHTVNRIRLQPAGLIFDIAGITDRNEAEKLRNFEIIVQKADLPFPEEDQLDPLDIEGCIVKTMEGREVGILKEVMQSAGQDILVIDHHGEEVLIPAVDSFIKDIDLAEGIIVIDPIEGLLDVNAN